MTEPVIVTPSTPDVDPRLKATCYVLMERMWMNKLVNRFEVLENDIVWEFPIPTVDSPYHVSMSVPHQRVLAEPWVVMSELMGGAYREIQRINGARDPRVASHFGRLPP